jgi:Na+-driven multidrug efflux pump
VRFTARGDAITPVKVAMGMVLLNFLLNITLIWTPLKEAGLAWSTAIAAIVQVFILLRLTRRYADHIVDQTVVSSWKQTAIVDGGHGGGGGRHRAGHILRIRRPGAGR